MARTFTVLEVAEHIDRRVREHWDNHFWVRGEVSGLKAAARSTFFDLVQADEDGRVLAQLAVSMPASKARLVDRRLAAVGQPLANGLEIRIKAQLSFWVPGGRLSLSLSDIDPAHTAGAIAVARRQLLADMTADGSASRQAGLPHPRMPLSLGLVTAMGSQAYHDLVDELTRSGHPFRLTVAASRVQGVHAPAEIVRAIGALGRTAGLDLVLLTRGGGAEIDLVTFDHPHVARAVADCPVPVWTGIGHHLDSPVAEQVAALACKTPTALAQAVVTAVADSRDRTETAWAGIRTAALRRLGTAERELVVASQRTASARVALRTAAARLDAIGDRVAAAPARLLRHRQQHLAGQRDRLGAAASAVLDRRVERLDRAGQMVELADPVRLLERGWTLTTTTDGRRVRGPLPVGTRLSTRHAAGTITSEVVDDVDD